MAKLNHAVDKFNEEFTVLAAKKKSSIPRLTVQQIAHSFDSVATTGDSQNASKDFHRVVEKLMLLNVSADQDTETLSTSKKMVQKTSDFVGKLLPLTSVALSLVGQTFGGSAMSVPITAIANGTAFLLQLAIKEKERKDQFLAELDLISYQARRVNELQKHPEEAIIPMMREKCLNLLAEIVNFLGAALNYLGQSFLKQFGKSLFLGAEIWQTSVKNLHLAYEEYDQALLLQIASTVIMQSQMVATKPRENDGFTKWLAPANSENDAQFMANLSQRAEGTLQWVLKLPEFRDWRLGHAEGTDSTAAQTLWFTGLPGTGKSTISAYLCDLLASQYPEDIILSFFCKRGTPGLTTAHRVVRTLCYQMIMKESFYRKFLQEKPELPTNQGKQNLLFLFNKLIKEPLNAGPRERSVFILLDGLDELEDSTTSNDTQLPSYNSKTEIEILLERLVNLATVKILITSRQSPQLNSILSKSGIIRPITGSDNAEDIKRYVKHRVGQSSKLRDGFTETQVDPIEFFNAKANGVFLWVAIVLDLLERTASSKAFQRALYEVPPTMNSVYDDILTRASNRGTIDLIAELLRWTMILPKPFTIRQMVVAAELSLGDKVFNMEEFLRTECGSLLDLVPTLGAGASYDESIEIHIGHETFQTWLAERSESKHDSRFAKSVAHGRAARVCLLYLTANPPIKDDSLQTYAITRWRWHLRLSMGIQERQFAESLAALEGGTPLPPALAVQIFGLLFKYFSSEAVEPWLGHHIQSKSHHKNLFWEVHHTCVETAAWCKTNKDALSDEAIAGLLDSNDPSKLRQWRDNIQDLQCTIDLLWPRACHVWVWNTSFDWWQAYWALDSLALLHIWGYDPSVLDETDAVRRVLEEEAKTVEENTKSPSWKRGGKLEGNLSVRLANAILTFDAEGVTRERCDKTFAAGGFDVMSGVCNANLSIALYRLSKANLQEALDAVQEAIDEDPDGGPRNHYHLGQIYDHTEKPELAMEAWRRAVELDPQRTTNARCAVYQTQENELLARDPPAYEEAVRLLEHAIVDDPVNASNRWFHHLFDIHKKTGDLQAARNTYQRLIAFDPTWHSYWEQIADTYIDQDEFERTRQFDWHSWCDSLAEAVVEDPSHANAYWTKWARKAEKLAEYQHFDKAVEILTYSVDTSARFSDKSARDAWADFQHTLGETLCKKGDWEGAVAPLEEAAARVDGWRKPDTLKLLAFTYMALERWEDARNVVEKRIAENEGGKDLGYALLGEICLLSGKASNAVKEYKRAIRIQEKELAEQAAEEGDAEAKKKALLDEDLGSYYTDLGLVYDRLSRTDQALACLRKALPHIEHGLEKAVTMRNDNGSLWRSEGRCHMRLAWLLERLDDPKAVEQYEKATWVFQRTVFKEDDFVERTEGIEAESSLERLRRGEKWSYLGDEEFRQARARARISSLRMNWGVSNYMDESRPAGMRGH